MNALARLLFIAVALLPGSMTSSNKGEPSSDELTRIVGGSEVPQNEYVPYQISLQYQTKRGITHFCGGSIIAPNRILTAAHCCQGLNVTRMTVVAGVRNLDDRTGYRSKALNCTTHPDYTALDTSDIAVLSIDPPLKYNNHTIAPISVKGKEFVPGNVSVTVTGWGRRFAISLPFLEQFIYPNSLRRMNYATITNEKCRARLMTKVTERDICAQGLFRGVCTGDSGGPLVMKTSKGVHQVGVVAYGLAICGLSITPDVYTRVSAFSDWIQKQL
ncbi:trypsin 3A1-like [Scaptodrosophila lebanonensis]|uniref:Trypsin 3A1-like n=1 Tax=Drosophila lebanonensis TaxID=7225 RepID=A0A6J2TF43_DROLE|nr:trypsin 3A1-like [Scaptodrosophila lebanonensis]